MNHKTCNFGEHLTIDGYGGSYEKLNDKKQVLRCLDDLPKKLGMKKLAKSVICSVPDNQKKDPGGWSGFIVVAESHISVHTFPRRGFVSADVYTCKEGMDCDYITKYFEDLFDLKDVETHFLKRGTHYPVENIHKN